MVMVLSIDMGVLDLELLDGVQKQIKLQHDA